MDVARPHSPEPTGRGFLHSTTRSRDADVTTLAEVDEALFHLSLVPEDERGAGWHASLDARLAQRVRLARTEQQSHETRLITAPETR